MSGEKACKSCRSRQELSNEYFLAKIGFDTAENELFNFHNFSSLQGSKFHQAVVSLACTGARERDGLNQETSDRSRPLEPLLNSIDSSSGSAARSPASSLLGRRRRARCRSRRASPTTSSAPPEPPPWLFAMRRSPRGVLCLFV